LNALLDIDLGNCAATLCHDGVEHFHSLQHEELLPK
jgi:hypothetical protein